MIYDSWIKKSWEEFEKVPVLGTRPPGWTPAYEKLKQETVKAVNEDHDLWLRMCSEYPEECKRFAELEPDIWPPFEYCPPADSLWRVVEK